MSTIFWPLLITVLHIYIYIFRDAVACTEGHLFCMPCISEWLRQDNSSCVLCRSYLDTADLRKIRQINFLVNELPTSCPHQGCTWEGPLERRDQYTLSACEYRRPNCDLCGASCTACGQANHEEFVCQRAPVNCPCCGDNIPR